MCCRSLAKGNTSDSNQLFSVQDVGLARWFWYNYVILLLLIFFNTCKLMGFFVCLFCCCVCVCVFFGVGVGGVGWGKPGKSFFFFFFFFFFFEILQIMALCHSELLNLHDRPLYSEVTFWGAYLPLPTAVLSDALGTGTRGQVPDDVPPARADCLCLRLQVWGPAPPGPASFRLGMGVRGRC